jgi:hypothetical protein
MNEANMKISDPDLTNLQHVNDSIKHLPYFDKIKANGFQSFKELKKNLLESLAINELRPGFSHWTNALNIFLFEYGLFFTKEDHIMLVKLYTEVMLTPDIDFPIIIICLGVLEKLLK